MPDFASLFAFCIAEFSKARCLCDFMENCSPTSIGPPNAM